MLKRKKEKSQIFYDIFKILQIVTHSSLVIIFIDVHISLENMRMREAANILISFSEKKLKNKDFPKSPSLFYLLQVSESLES